jgi:RNA polymerase sigma-70 factor (ECF subfamily)
MSSARLAALSVSQRDELVRRARKIVGDTEQAEDVVQETLLLVWKLVGRKSIRDSRAYLSRAVYWNALKYRARRRSMLPLEHGGHDVSGTTSRADSWTLDPLDLESALLELPLAQQAVIRLHYYLGLSFREMGAALSISTNTAASRARYALRALRIRLGGAEPRRITDNGEKP